MKMNRMKHSLLAATAGATLLASGALAQGTLDTGAAARTDIDARTGSLVLSQATLQTGITVDVTTEEADDPNAEGPGLTESATDANMEQGTSAAPAPSYYIDADVYAGDDARLGSISDVVRDPNTGDVYFVIYQENGETMPVPVSRFTVDQDNRMTLPDYTPEGYATYMGLDVSMYERVQDADGNEPDEVEPDTSMEHGTSGDEPSYHIDVDVFATADAPVGHIDDVVRDPATGEVYLVISQEATADMPARQVAVPAEHFSLDAQDHVMWPAYTAEEYQGLPDYDASMYERVTVE
ncbi:MAG: PRC-barrel domain-containing protein [Rhodospirillaceae bacterium]|nr:PRC-barrel domain-containing protein [Rhodospirillaceae bacterium]